VRNNLGNNSKGSFLVADARSLTGATSDLDSQSQHITFKKFTITANLILKQNYKKEEYAQLVSVPSMYKKACNILLSDLNPQLSEEEQDEKMKELINNEFKS